MSQESRSWLPTFLGTPVGPWPFRTIRATKGRKSRKERLGALRILLRGGSHVKIVHSFFRLRSGLAEEHSIVYYFRLTEMTVAESCSLNVVVSEVSRVPQGVLAQADKFWVPS
jgi:hypothetical protein